MVCKIPINEGHSTFCTFCFANSCQAKKWLVAIPGVEDSIIEHILVCFLGEVTQKVYALMHIKFTSCRVMCVNNVTIVDDSLAALISAHK